MVYDDANDDELASSTAAEMYAKTRSNLNAMNYVEVSDKADADIVVNYYMTTSQYVDVQDWYYQERLLVVGLQ